MAVLLEKEYPDSVRTYQNISELRSDHPDQIINGVEIERDFSFTESDGLHHTIIEFVGRYGYDNVIVGTLGATKTVYLLKNGNVNRALESRDIQLLESDDFIVLGRSLYHIPTGKSTIIESSSFELVKRRRNLFDFRRQDKQVKWTGSRFKKYDNIKPKDVEPEGSVDIDERMENSKDVENVEDDSDLSYGQLLRNIVNDIYWVNNIEEAEKYVNGKFDLPDREKEKRRYLDMKDRYASGKIDMKRFEEELEQFLIDNEEYIWTTGEYSDTEISDIGEDEGNDSNQEDLSAFNW